MKYLLIIHNNPAFLDALSAGRAGRADGRARTVPGAAARDRRADRLRRRWPTRRNSRAVRVRDGVPVVTDGPFLEAKEYLAGYYLVDCESMERAVELAAMMPEARYEGVEVRPVHGGPAGDEM